METKKVVGKNCTAKKLPHKHVSKDRTAKGTVTLTAFRMWLRWEPTGLGYLQDTGLVTRVLTRQVAFRGDRHILSSPITSRSFPWKERQMYPTSNNCFPLAADRPGPCVLANHWACLLPAFLTTAFGSYQSKKYSKHGIKRRKGKLYTWKPRTYIIQNSGQDEQFWKESSAN